MSEIKVNKISPRTACGTTTLGDSGDTFIIPAGATITNNGTAGGFGATGAASWDTTPKTGTFTAVSGIGYFVNTTAGVISVNLPAGSAGDVVAIKDYANTFDTNNVTLIQNGSDKIGGSTNNAILSTEGLAVTLVFVDSTQGWLVTDDGLQSVSDTNPYMIATGGTITCSGDYKIHTFTGPGTFAVTTAATSVADNLVSYVVVAGGAGGGGGTPNWTQAGGGGAGGFREVVSPSSPYTGSPLNGYPTPGNRITVSETSYPIVVGAGGTAGQGPPNATKGGSGGVSTFDSITSAGGGGGGTYDAPQAAATGGSGGGGANASCTPNINGAAGNTPPVSPAQGSSGGNANRSFAGPSAYQNFAGGGGGATGAGGNGGPTGDSGQGGVGGAGATSEITASSVVYAGGGGGAGAGINSSGNPIAGFGGVGGTGGGGGGQTTGRTGPNSVPWSPSTSGGAGVDNTGGGGGGGGALGDSVSPEFGRPGGTGGSGIVMIRYKFQ